MFEPFPGELRGGPKGGTAPSVLPALSGLCQVLSGLSGTIACGPRYWMLLSSTMLMAPSSRIRGALLAEFGGSILDGIKM